MPKIDIRTPSRSAASIDSIRATSFPLAASAAVAWSSGDLAFHSSQIGGKLSAPGGS